MRLVLEGFIVMKILKLLLLVLLAFLLGGVWAFVLHIIIGTTPLTPLGSISIAVFLIWLFYVRGLDEEDE